jgi:hypothetical protein
VGALLELRRRTDRIDDVEECLDILRRQARDLQTPSGRFRIHDRSPLTYAHSHCYACEGLLMLRDADAEADISADGDADGEVLSAAAEWLASAQRPDGALHAWYDGDGAIDSPVRLDATAQMVRVLRVVEPGRFAPPIARARAHLSAQLVDGRSLPYEPGSPDLNAWTTMFAVQALADDDDRCAATSGRRLV